MLFGKLVHCTGKGMKDGTGSTCPVLQVRLLMHAILLMHIGCALCIVMEPADICKMVEKSLADDSPWPLQRLLRFVKQRMPEK